jgi:uncharacterized protein YegP (UPF0339 family)
MYWEVVITAPKGQVRYHARLRLPTDRTLFKSPDYPTIEAAYHAIELAREHAAIAPVYEVDES